MLTLDKKITFLPKNRKKLLRYLQYYKYICNFASGFLWARPRTCICVRTRESATLDAYR